MKKLFYLTLLLWGVASCYPPRIVYALDDIHSLNNDSIDIQLLKGSTISIDAQVITSMLSIEVWNKSNSTLIFHKKNRLEAFVDSVTLYYELVESDSLPYQLQPKSKKNIFLIFKAKDPKYLLYNSINNKNGHFLKLYLKFQNISGKEIDKKITLKSVKTRRWVYEKEN